MLDVVFVLRGNLSGQLKVLTDKLEQELRGTPIAFTHGVIVYRDEECVYLLFRRDTYEGIFAFATPYVKANAIVAMFDKNTFKCDGNSVNFGQLQDFLRQGQHVVVVWEKGQKTRVMQAHAEVRPMLQVYTEAMIVDGKSYTVAALREPDYTSQPSTRIEDYKHASSTDKPMQAYYGQDSTLAQASARSQVKVEPIEISGATLVSGQDFRNMDGENLYETVPRYGEFPEDESGETLFYVNKRADSFVEVYHTTSDRIYVIKAMDPMFFSKVAMSLHKTDGIRLELLVKRLDVLATFLTKFGHPDMTFDMEALPDKSIEVRILVKTWYIARTKNLLRNVFQGEDGYGKTKYEKLQQLKQKRKPMRTNASIKQSSDGSKVFIGKTGNDVLRFDPSDKKTWESKLTSQPKDAVHQFLFKEKYSEVDEMVEYMRARGWECVYEDVDGQHSYTFFHDNPLPERDMIIPDPVSDVTEPLHKHPPRMVVTDDEEDFKYESQF